MIPTKEGQTCCPSPSLAAFSLNYDRPSLFAASQWQKDKNKAGYIFLAYRILIAAFLLASYVAWAADGNTNLIFLTHQGITILTVTEVFAAALVAAELISPSQLVEASC